MELAKIDERLQRIETMLSTLKAEPQTARLEREPYMTREDLRKLFHISLPTVDRWTEEGVFVASRIGNRIFYDPQQIRSILEKR